MNTSKDEIMEDVELEAEEMEEVIAPISCYNCGYYNHNEAMVNDEEVALEAEELEEVIAPALTANYNQAMVSDEETETPVG